MVNVVKGIGQSTMQYIFENISAKFTGKALLILTLPILAIDFCSNIVTNNLAW